MRTQCRSQGGRCPEGAAGRPGSARAPGHRPHPPTPRANPVRGYPSPTPASQITPTPEVKKHGRFRTFRLRGVRRRELLEWVVLAQGLSGAVAALSPGAPPECWAGAGGALSSLTHVLAGWPPCLSSCGPCFVFLYIEPFMTWLLASPSGQVGR